MLVPPLCAGRLVIKILGVIAATRGCACCLYWVCHSDSRLSPWIRGISLSSSVYSVQTFVTNVRLDSWPLRKSMSPRFGGPLTFLFFSIWRNWTQLPLHNDILICGGVVVPTHNLFSSCVVSAELDHFPDYCLLVLQVIVSYVPFSIAFWGDILVSSDSLGDHSSILHPPLPF